MNGDDRIHTVRGTPTNLHDNRPTCDGCGSELEIRPDEPGIRTRWYACPTCDEARNPDGSSNGGMDDS